MTQIELGFWAVHRRRLYEEPAATELARLLTDERWPWQPRIVRPEQRPGYELYPWPRGKIAAAKLRGVVHDIVRSPLSLGICLVTAQRQDLDLASLNVRTGQERPSDESSLYPFHALTLCRGTGLEAGKSIEGWLELMHELVQLIEAPHALIWASSDYRPIVARQYLTGSVRPENPPEHPAHEIRRANHARRELGARYIRDPAWGTYLGAEHVAALGGRARIVEAVQPPVVREIGALLYVQLSERVADALAPEVDAKRRAFVALCGSISAPQIA